MEKTIKIINKKLKKEIYKKLDKYSDLAISYYTKGDMKKGKKYEKMGDDLYKKYYNKIYK